MSELRAAAEQPQPVEVMYVQDGLLRWSKIPQGYTGYLYAAPPPPAAAPCPHIRSSGTGEWATNWCALNGPPPPAAAPSEDERRLRRWLCAARHGRSAYMDDGEASDCSAHPFIDYLRDSIDEIEAKWRQRAAAAARKA